MQEKFLTIQLALCGRGSLGLHINEMLAFRLKALFKQLQVPFAHVAERPGKRHSFISYNFVFRRLFDLLGCSHLGMDFPPLKSKKKRDDIVAIWIRIISYLRWPYINSDARLYGASHAVRFADLDRRSTKAPASRKRKAEDPEPSGDRFRGSHSDSESGQYSRGESDAILSDFCDTLQRAAGGGFGGFDNGNLVWLGDSSF